MPLTVTRRGDRGTLQITGVLNLPDGSKIRIRQRSQSDRRQLAEEEAAALEAKLLRDAYHGERKGSRSFSSAVVSYLEAAPRSTAMHRDLKRCVIALGDVPISAIDHDTIARLKQALFKPDAAPGTITRGALMPIRAVLNYAHRQGWCDAPHIEVPRERPGRVNYLLPDEARRLIEAAAPHIKPLLIFLLGTGARMAEAIELEWRDLDLVGARATFWRTKGGSRRVAKLPPDTLNPLIALPYREGAVFRRADGRPYADKARESGGQIKTAWHGAIRRAGLGTHLTPHDLRHTWASWHYAVHRDLLALKVEGGWSSVVLVERYAHLLPKGHETAISAFWNGDTVMTPGDQPPLAAAE